MLVTMILKRRAHPARLFHIWRLPSPLVGSGVRQDCRFGKIHSPKAMAAAAIDRPAA